MRGALYTLDIGGNDIFKALDELHAGQISPSVAGTAIAQAESQHGPLPSSSLFALGARNLLFYHGAGSGAGPPSQRRRTGPRQNPRQRSCRSHLIRRCSPEPRPARALGPPRSTSVPTYADLDLVASKPSYFAPQYGIEASQM